MNFADNNNYNNNAAVANVAPVSSASSYSASSLASSSSSSSFTTSTGPDGLPHTSSNQAAYQAAAFATKGPDGVLKSGAEMQSDSLATQDGKIISSAHHQAASGTPIDPLSRAAIQGQQMQRPPIPSPLPQLQLQHQQQQPITQQQHEQKTVIQQQQQQQQQLQINGDIE